MSNDKPEEEEGIRFSMKTSSFKEIIMDHLRRITILYSCELRGGYYSTFKTKSGEEKEYYVEDSREALENAIYCFTQLLIPKFSDSNKTYFDEFEKQREKLKQDFLKRTSLNETEVLGEAYYDEEDKVPLEEYKIKKLNLYKGLFTELIRLLAKKNYLEAGEEMF